MGEKQDQPIVSVIISCYNHENLIADAIDSVMNQTYDRFELIISDDGSTDGSRKVIEDRIHAWNDDSRIKLIASDKNTTFAVLEEAYRTAKGKYVCGIGGDDAMAPTRLEKQVDFLESHQDEINACFTWLKCVGSDGLKKDTLPAYFNRKNVPSHELLKQMLIQGNCLSAPSFMMKRECFVKYGGYDFDYRQLQDYALWLRYLLEEQVYIIPEVLTYYGVVEGSLSDSSSDPGVEIRTYEEQEELLYEVFLNMKEDIFDKMFPDADGTHHTDLHLRCRQVKTLMELVNQNSILGAVALRLYFQYKKHEGFRETLEKEYGIDRKMLYRFISENSIYGYVVRQQNTIRLLQDAHDRHRFDLNNADSNDATMVEAMLDKMEEGTGALTLDHIVALYDYCKGNGNTEEDFLAMLHEAKGKGVSLFS